MKQFRESVVDAIENQDYSVWKTLMESQLTEEKFNKLTERYASISERHEKIQEIRKAIQNGDTETANALKEELGFSQDFRGRHGFHKMRQGSFGLGYR